MHTACDERTHAVGPNHETGLLFHAATAWMPPNDARHAVTLPEKLLDEEAFAQVRPGYYRSLHEHRIQDDAPGSAGRGDFLDSRRGAA